MLLKVSQLGSRRVRIRTQVIWLQGHPPNHKRYAHIPDTEPLPRFCPERCCSSFKMQLEGPLLEFVMQIPRV